MKKVQAISAESSLSSYEIIKNADRYEQLSSAQFKLKDFADMIEALREYNKPGALDGLYDRIIETTGLDEYYMIEDSTTGKDRVENVKELKSAIVTMQQSYEEDYGQTLTLAAFLENVTLSTDADKEDISDDHISIMTLHSAKGLEFRVVFLVGLEEGLFPSFMSLNESMESLEEERRLCYVGITRSMEKLYCTYAVERTKYGKTQPCDISRFLKEIPHELVDGSRRTQKSNEPSSLTLDKLFSRDSGFSVTRGGKPVNIPGLTATVGESLKKEDYDIGDRVVHKKYGEGVIKDLYDDKGMDIVEVDFDMAGIKRLVIEFAKLVKLK